MRAWVPVFKMRGLLNDSSGSGMVGRIDSRCQDLARVELSLSQDISLLSVRDSSFDSTNIAIQKVGNPCGSSILIIADTISARAPAIQGYPSGSIAVIGSTSFANCQTFSPNGRSILRANGNSQALNKLACTGALFKTLERRGFHSCREYRVKNAELLFRQASMGALRVCTAPRAGGQRTPRYDCRSQNSRSPLLVVSLRACSEFARSSSLSISARERRHCPRRGPGRHPGIPSTLSPPACPACRWTRGG